MMERNQGHIVRFELAHLGSKIKTTCINPYFLDAGCLNESKETLILPMLEEQYVANRIVRVVNLVVFRTFLPADF